MALVDGSPKNCTEPAAVIGKGLETRPCEVHILTRCRPMQLSQRGRVRGACRAHRRCHAIGREGKSHRPINATTLPLTAAMVERMKTPEARTAYRRRKWLSEAPNGWIKNVLGFRQFSLRGLHRVQAEWKLVCMALNLRRMATLSAR
jgi:hypothetical protein